MITFSTSFILGGSMLIVELILFRRNRLYVLELPNLSVSFFPIVEKKLLNSRNVHFFIEMGSKIIQSTF